MGRGHMCVRHCLANWRTSYTDIPWFVPTALGESDDEADAPGSSAGAAASTADATGGAGGDSKTALSEKLRRAALLHKAGKQAADAAPTTSFQQKRALAQVFDDPSPDFDKESYVAAENKVKAEKVRLSHAFAFAVLCPSALKRSCATHTYKHTHIPEHYTPPTCVLSSEYLCGLR